MSDRLLLDTHALLWWLADVELHAEAVEQIATAPIVLVSAASIWEAGIKMAGGKLAITAPLLPAVAEAGFRELPITGLHAQEAAQLPAHHRDPFDRMLIGQARVEGATIVTRDRKFADYDVDLIRC